MRRFFINSPLCDKMVITGEDAHHLSRVLRTKPGDEIIVVDEKGKSGIACVAAVSGFEVALTLKERISEHKEPPVKVWLAQGLPKADKMDYIIQKAVELGVYGVLPMAADHCVVRYDKSKQAARRERWQKIAAEAAKQCGRTFIPGIHPIQSLADILDKLERDAKVIMCYEGERSQGIKNVLSLDTQASYLVLIGPEGGFSANELSLCEARGAHIVTMGPRILRTETAALTALAILMYECGDLGG